MLIGEAARQRHFGERCSRVAHEGLRALHALMQLELVRGLAGGLAKAANEMRAAHPSLPSQIA